MSILEPIYAHDRERIAARVGTALITYGRLTADIDAMAHWLLGEGLNPGDRVTLHSQAIANPAYWDWIMQLGAIRAGLVNSTGGMPPAVAASGAIGPYAAAVGVLAGLPAKANPARKLAYAPSRDAPLAEQLTIKDTRKLDGLEARSVRLLATSGTTGRPKVVVWDAGLFEARLKQVREIGDITPDTSLLVLLGMITTTGLRYPIAAWQLGATVLLAGFSTETRDFVDMTAASTFLATSPFRMQDVLKRAPGEWPRRETRVIELFGGRVAPLLREEVLKRCCSALRMSYGATEVGRVAAGDTRLVERDDGAVGMVEPGITVEIVGPKGNPVPAGKPGIVRMKSDFMVGGYAGLPAPSGPRASFRDGWFYPGDIGIVYEDGLFAITGRTAETLNLAGAKLSPIAFEEKLTKLPEIQDVCVVVMQLDQGDLLTVAAVCAPGTDIPALRKKIRPLLPKQFPFAFFTVAEIPRNAMGRIPRGAVAKKLAARIKEQQASAKDTT